MAKAFTTWSNQKPTHTKREPYSNVTTGNSSDKKDTRQLVICEFRGSTDKPDGKVHFRYSGHNSERPQTTFSKATWQGNRLHSKFTADASPHRGPGDVLAKAFTTWSNQKPTHTKREPIPVSQRVIHPTKGHPPARHLRISRIIKQAGWKGPFSLL